jgi:hypothetical protein
MLHRNYIKFYACRPSITVPHAIPHMHRNRLFHDETSVSPEVNGFPQPQAQFLFSLAVKIKISTLRCAATIPAPRLIMCQTNQISFPLIPSTAVTMLGLYDPWNL